MTADATVTAPEPSDVELWAAVARLSERQQRCVVLRYVHDLPEGEIAELLGIARGTVAATLHAARKSLRAEYAEEWIHG